MTSELKATFVPEVAEDIRGLGYEATQFPLRIPGHNVWQDGLSGLFRKSKHRPDILVQHGDQSILVETKTRPVLLGSVIQARNYATHFGVSIILCVPDDALSRIPLSVRQFADDNDVRLCTKSEIEDALKGILG